uniref:Uncharacterized protein n=1 Tax=Arundo donax TaxID=35708 RepID=A0A0A9FNK4_ARUDO
MHPPMTIMALSKSLQLQYIMFTKKMDSTLITNF